VHRQPGQVVIEARVRAAAADCPRCGQLSGRVHGHYVRRLRDATVSGVQVVISLTVRRFRCQNAACPAVTFAEQVAGLTWPDSRFTPLLRGLLTQIGLALAGRAGVRLAAAAGVTVGRDTLLWLVRALPDPVAGPVPVLGVDDFAVRRGRHYGTVLIDMATHRPIDIFDGREGADLAAWLHRHREVAVICRDRAGGYGEGARAGAPQAMQVADRFHLWQNLGQAVEKTVNTRRAHLGEPASPATQAAPAVLQPPVEKKIVTRIRMHYDAVQQLQAQGLSKEAISRKLGLHRATVRKFATARSTDDLIAKTEQRTHLVDPFTGHLHQRWHEGERNATQLFREIQHLGYPGGELAVQRYLRQFRHGRSHAARPAGKPPTVRQVTSWIMTHPDELDRRDAAKLRGIRGRDADLDRLTRHVRAFAIMMTGRHGDRLEDWITTVESDTLTPLAAFAHNLRRDLDAVTHGLTLPYSSGPVEGNINRLKMLKRQMFGRAGLDLLRKRVLPAHRPHNQRQNPHLDHDRVDEHRGVHLIERPAAPAGHLLDHLAGDPADRLRAHRRVINLREVRADLAGGQPPGIQRQDHFIHPGQPPLPLADDLRLERAVPAARHPDGHLAGAPGQHRLGPGAVAHVPRRRLAVLFMPQVLGHLLVQRGLQHRLGQLFQQPVRAGQRQAPLPGPAHQLLGRLLLGGRLRLVLLPRCHVV
jgi:transposase